MAAPALCAADVAMVVSAYGSVGDFVSTMSTCSQIWHAGEAAGVKLLRATGWLSAKALLRCYSNVLLAFRVALVFVVCMLIFAALGAGEGSIHLFS